jgi:acetyl-CoA carboxylase biotin carboxyl carrier protein
MSSDTFDLKRVKQLVELMKANDLTDVEIKQGEWQITLRRGAHTPMIPNMAMPMQTMPMQTPTTQASTQTAPTAASASTASEEPANTTVIKSPMVGTFYTASSPDAPPFAKVGDTVTPEKTVCLIEAMKVYNEIQAECSGKIIAVLAKNGESVEYGRPLFRVAVG